MCLEGAWNSWGRALIGINAIADVVEFDIGVAYDFLIALLGSGIGKGMTMIFGG